MAYKNPFLSRLSEGEEQRRYELSRQDRQTAANDRRYSEASDTFQKLPFTLNDMINEERDRKEKVRQFEVGKSQVDRAYGLQERKYEDGLSATEKALGNTRARELAKNAATAGMFTPEGEAAPLPAMPVSRQPEMQAPAPLDLKSLRESMSMRSDTNAPIQPMSMQGDMFAPIQSMSMSVRQSGPLGGSGGMRPSGDRVGVTPGHAHIAETGLPKNETLLEQSKPGDREMARAILAKYPDEIGKYLTEDDIAADIARNRIMADTTAHKQGMDHDKLELQRMQIASREQMAKMQMDLRRRLASQAKMTKGTAEYALTSKENEILTGATNSIGAISAIEDRLAMNETSFLKGVETKIRQFTKTVDPNDVAFQARLGMTINEEIKRLAGSAVSESEAGRILSTMPDVWMDPVAFRQALGALKEQSLRKYKTTLEQSEYNSLNRKGQRVPDELKNRFNENPAQSQNLGAKIESKLDSYGL
jgi:hypothetical protein